MAEIFEKPPETGGRYEPLGTAELLDHDNRSLRLKAGSAAVEVIAADVELWPVLKEEMRTFKRTLTPRGVSYRHEKNSDHDDVLLAAALAAFGLTYHPGGNLQQIGAAVPVSRTSSTPNRE